MFVFYHFMKTVKPKLLLILALFFLNGMVMGQIPTNGFANKVDFSVASNVQGVATGDLNGDSKPDIISANLGGNSITIRLNQSNQNRIDLTSFGGQVNLLTLNNGPQQVFVKDLNFDGKLDILVGYSSGTSLSFFINNYTSGVFSSSNFTRTELLTSTGPAGIVAADFDLDGKEDIATATYASNQVLIYRNTSLNSSSISFASPAVYSSITSAPNSLAVGHIDQDGKFDIAISNWSGSYITVLKNQSSGTGNINFSSGTTTTQTNPYWVRIEDLDNDGLGEVICSNNAPLTVSIFKNTSTTSIAFSTRYDLPFTPGSSLQATAIADYDGDNLKDIAGNVANNNFFYIAKNTHTSGVFSSTSFSSRTSFTTGSVPVGAASTDFDNDGRPDILVGNYTSMTMSVFKNHMLAVEPTMSASSINVVSGINTATITLSKGNGIRRMGVLRSSSSLTAAPIDSNWYNSNDTFGLGSNLGNGNFVVFQDTGSSFVIKGLVMGQSYSLTIYEYNGVKGFSNYFTTGVTQKDFTMNRVYFSKSSGNLNDTATWGLNPDGTGQTPSDFNQPNTIYNIRNNASPSLNSNWFVVGSNTSVKIGDGVNPLTLNITNSGSLFVDSFSVSALSTINIQGGIISNKAFFDTLSTAQYTSPNAQNILPFNFYNLLVAGGMKNFIGNTLVRNSINMLTSINLNSHVLTCGISNSLPGTINRMNGTIIGKLRRWYSNSITPTGSGFFPIGTNTAYYPANLEFTTAPSSGGYITGEFINAIPGNSGLPLYDFTISPIVEINKTHKFGYWRFEAIGLVGGTNTVILSPNGIFGVNSLSTLRVVKRINNGAWFLQGSSVVPSGTGSSPVLQRTGLTGFGDYTIGSDSVLNSLPVTFGNLEGKVKENKVILNWSTLSESNNLGFVVEKKSTREFYDSIGFVKGKGNSAINNYYHFYDDQIVDGLPIFYRIKQIDLDGKFDYSNEILVENRLGEVFEVYPNPATDFITMRSAYTGNAELINSLGNRLQIEFLNGVADISKIDAGIYFVKIEGQEPRKIVILK